MRLGSIRYLIKEGFKGTWANRLMSLASVGVLVACMVVIGLAILISENINMAIGTLEKQNVVHVYLKDKAWVQLYGEETQEDEKTVASDSKENEEDDTEVETEEPNNEIVIDEDDYLIHNDEEAEEICSLIKKIDNVDKAVVITPEEGLEKMTKDMSDEQKETFNFLNEDNPMSYAIEITMKDMGKFDQTIKQLNDIDEVFNIQTYDGLAEKINVIKKGIYVAGFWIIGILIAISLVIVSNTIRVTMYNRKLEISIMKAVGATNAFVRIPFVIEGMLIGLISAIISEGIIYFCYRVATDNITKIFGQVVPFGDVSLYLLIVFAAIGIFAGALGSFIMIGKYLRREGSEFTAI